MTIAYTEQKAPREPRLELGYLFGDLRRVVDPEVEDPRSDTDPLRCVKDAVVGRREAWLLAATDPESM